VKLAAVMRKGYRHVEHWMYPQQAHVAGWISPKKLPASWK